MDELYRINIEGILTQAGLLAQVNDAIGTDEGKAEAIRESLRGILGAAQNIGIIPAIQAIEEEIALDMITPILAEVLCK
ncbi:hypothetical protein A3844_24985 [Paenibacillus helianthi]|uniref:Uncharacterized protein n=1 Tax=Paenibacillus helianthi TaxID=1349432 RepID=A0ABX3EKN3_9BACL|nr:hypothetical protein [Paenibacillus helianthi]OKP81843.1 hypothetical protein A3844_24985 [Paenibacillus helianthi]